MQTCINSPRTLTELCAYYVKRRSERTFQVIRCTLCRSRSECSLNVGIFMNSGFDSGGVAIPMIRRSSACTISTVPAFVLQGSRVGERKKVAERQFKIYRRRDRKAAPWRTVSCFSNSVNSCQLHRPV